MARFGDIIRDNERLRAENAQFLEENTRNKELLSSGRDRIEGLMKENQELRGHIEAVLTTIELKRQESVK